MSRPVAEIDLAAARVGAPPPTLWADYGCPFAQRVRALCAHLGWPLTLHEAAVGAAPPGLERYSPSRRLPYLTHGELLVGESRVMLEHLAEYHGFAEAMPADLPSRTAHRHAMALVDGFLVPRMTVQGPESAPARLGEILDTIERSTRTTPPGPCLLAFHVAPVWLRAQLWSADGSVVRGVTARPALHRWLDQAAALEGVRRTTPDDETLRCNLDRARQAGLLPWETSQDSTPRDSFTCTIPTQPRAASSAGDDPTRSPS